MTEIWQTLGHLISFRTITAILLILTLLWFLKLMVKKQIEYLFRASLILIFIFLIFIFFQRSEIGKWDVFEIKGKIFPEKIPTLNYHQDREILNEDIKLRYVFKEPKPKLILTLDKRGNYLHLWNFSSLNLVLKALDLPQVHQGVPELASITGSRYDIRQYRWGDYPLGILIIERDLCQDKKNFQSYHCLSAITIKYR
jgi:hypothetical protein